MRAERGRLKRLHRLEKVRALIRQEAALEAARAEGTLAQLAALAERTRRMGEDYRGRMTLGDGLALQQLGSFVAGLNAVAATAQDDAARARQTADALQQELALAERRRAAVEDRIRAGERALAQRAAPPVLEGKRAVGTVYE